MDKVIFKYPLEVTDSQSVVIPIGAEILSVQTQNGHPCLWALVDPKADTEKRIVEIFGTGNLISYGIGVSRKYISTFQLEDGLLVFHAFEYTGI